MAHFKVAAVAAGEGAGFVDFVVRLEGGTVNEARVSFQLDNGSARYNGAQDYVFQSGTLIFAPGETSKTLRVVLSDDTLAEQTELFWLDLHTPVNAGVAQRYTPALVFDNDAAAGTPAFTVSDPVVDEADRSASFFVYLVWNTIVVYAVR